MKTAPITVTEMVILGGVVVGGFLAYRAIKALPSPSDIASTAKNAVAGAANAASAAPADFLAWTAENNRIATENNLKRLEEKYPDGRSPVQSWVADTVQKGQEAGASTFVTSFFTGLFK